MDPGGAYFPPADSSVQFIDETISRAVYRGYSTIAGGEVSDAEKR